MSSSVVISTINGSINGNSKGGRYQKLNILLERMKPVLGKGGLKCTFCGEAMDIFLKEYNFKCVKLF